MQCSAKEEASGMSKVGGCACRGPGDALIRGGMARPGHLDNAPIDILRRHFIAGAITQRRKDAEKRVFLCLLGG